MQEVRSGDKCKIPVNNEELRPRVYMNAQGSCTPNKCGIVDFKQECDVIRPHQIMVRQKRQSKRGLQIIDVVPLA